MNNTQLKKKFEEKCLELSYKYDNEITLAIDDLWSFIHSVVEKQRKEIEKEIRGMKQLPYYAQPAQNRNGMDYCATCEQAWEDCSCSARNTGYKKALQDVIDLLAHKKETKK